jgi:hypothetical protein
VLVGMQVMGTVRFFFFLAFEHLLKLPCLRSFLLLSAVTSS